MTPDDPRHGSRAGYYAHRTAGQDACAPCKRGAAAAEAQYELDRIHGRTRRVSPVGTKRRLRAMYALGWTWVAIAREIGTTRAAVEKWANEDRQFMYLSTASAVAELYDRACMTRPEGPMAERARRAAARRGYAPPLAWDDIDNDPAPVDAPVPKRQKTLATVEDFDWLVAQGESEDEAAARLGVQPESIRDMRKRAA